MKNLNPNEISGSKDKSYNIIFHILPSVDFYEMVTVTKSFLVKLWSVISICGYEWITNFTYFVLFIYKYKLRSFSYEKKPNMWFNN